jgi:hypothetical protein
MARNRAPRAVPRIDPKALADFRTAMRRQYTDDEMREQLRACAGALGRSPTMREFDAWDGSSIHSQTVIARFGSWNRAKRQAGLLPRRGATKEELLLALRELGEQLGRVPTSRDIDEHRGLVPSKSLYWHTFGSLTNALRDAGFDVPVGEERLERAVAQGVDLAQRVGRLPTFAEWGTARREDSALLSEWQIYRMFEERSSAWLTFLYLVKERLETNGVAVAPDGSLQA